MIDFDRTMIGDSVRNAAFARALEKLILPGKSTVTDIGAGTGILSFIASRKGARRCYAYDFSPVLKLAKVLAKENGIGNCTFIHKHTSEVRSPTKTDIVMTETFGNFCYEEHLIENLNDALRFVAPCGHILPFSVTQWVQPIGNPRLFEELCAWDRVGWHLTFTAAKRISLNNIYVKSVRSSDLLASCAPKQWDQIESGRKLESIRNGRATWTMSSSSSCYGFCLWWEAALTENVTLSTSPAAPVTHWQQIYAPVLHPLELQMGDTLRLDLESDSRYRTGINLVWNVVHERKGRNLARQELTMRLGRMA
jgi:protein arginine N-methyltransferase 1